LEGVESKRKISSMFLLVVEATNKKKFIIMDAMDHINTNPFEIHKNKTKFHEMTFKHFKYLKERNKKVHKMNNNMVKV
jgi:hypothetical protein